jgi:hypothetical protein
LFCGVLFRFDSDLIGIAHTSLLKGVLGVRA